MGGFKPGHRPPARFKGIQWEIRAIVVLFNLGNGGIGRAPDGAEPPFAAEGKGRRLKTSAWLGGFRKQGSSEAQSLQECSPEFLCRYLDCGCSSHGMVEP